MDAVPNLMVEYINNGFFLHHGTFRSAISKKLKELGYDTRDTNVWVDKMRRFYDQIYAETNLESDPAGGVM